jgi:hypothetical protein
MLFGKPKFEVEENEQVMLEHFLSSQEPSN